MRGHTQAELDKELEAAAAKTAKKGREEDMQDEEETQDEEIDHGSIRPEIQHDAAQFANEYNASAAMDEVCGSGKRHIYTFGTLPAIHNGRIP